MDFSSTTASVLFGALLLFITVTTVYHSYLQRQMRRLDDADEARERAAARVARGEPAPEAAGDFDGPESGVDARRDWRAIAFGVVCVALPGWALIGVLRDHQFPDLLWAIPFGVGVVAGLLLIVGGLPKSRAPGRPRN